MDRKGILFRRTALQSSTTWHGEKTNGTAYQAAFRKLTSMVDGVERQAHPWPDWAVTTEIDTSAYLAHRLESCLLPSDTDVHL